MNIIQVADTYGVCPPDAPNFNNASNICYNLLFYMVTCHALIDEIWEETQLCNYSYNQWNGFLLHYTTQYCLRPFRNNCGRRVHRSSPYYKFANKLKKHQQEHELVGYFQVETIDGRHDYSYNYAELVHDFAEHTNIRIVKPEYNADYLDFPDLVDDNVHTLIFINTVPATKRAFFSDEQMEHVHPNTYSDRNGCIWELRFLGASKTSTDDRHRNTNWQRTLCFRYGGQLHTNWWKISGSQTRFLKASGDSPSYDQLESWDILVYVKTEHGDTSGLKQQFLEALGGQLSWKCNKHNVLLVDTPHRRAVTPHCCCSRDLSITCDDSLLSTPEVNYCARKVKYCCTERSCNVGICHKHHRALSLMKDQQHLVENATNNSLSFHKTIDGEDHDVRLFPPREIIPVEDDHMNLAQDILNHQDDLFMDVVPPAIQDFIEFEDETEHDFDLANNDIDIMSRCSIQTEISDESSECTNQSDCDKSNTNDINNKGFDINEAGIISTINNSKIPTTSAGKLPMEILTKSPHIPLHVILNHCGSLLVRTGHKIRPSKNGRNFLQTLVSRCPGKTIPILYPEAMLFPSIFWKNVDTCVPIGAFPNALLNDDAFLAKYGIAPLGLHIRSRLMDTSCLTSTDTRHIAYCMDENLNLNLRGQDSRVVLSRGLVAGGITAGGGEHQKQRRGSGTTF